MAFKDLFRPKWKHSDPAVRRVAVEKLTDQSILAEVAINDSDSYVRYAAVGNLNLTDQLVIAVAIQDSDVNVRRTAVYRLKEQSVLARVAKNDKDRDVRECAIANLTDQDLLWRFVKKGKTHLECETAVRQLVNPVMLADLAKNDPRHFVRMAAVQTLSDPSGVADVVKNATDSEIINIASAKWSKIETEIRKLQAKLHNVHEPLWRRVSAAECLIAFYQKHNMLLPTNWEQFQANLTEPHFDNHGDSSSDCTNDGHTDTGLGLSFPPFTPGQESK